MIDLAEKGMPNAVDVDGVPFLLSTDFRNWLDFPEKMTALSKGDFSGYNGLFADTAPFVNDDILSQLGEFFSPSCPIPRENNSEERLIDFVYDADLIFSAFMQVYNIDLTETDMHWHKFRALLSGIPEETVLSRVMSIRSYKGKDSEMKKLRYAWELPEEYTDEELKLINEFNGEN